MNRNGAAVHFCAAVFCIDKDLSVFRELAIALVDKKKG